MAKYRSNPVVIEAEQWFPGKVVHGVCDGACLPPKYRGGPCTPHVHTIHNGGDSTVKLEPGDWVIPEPDGEHFYPCKPAIFEATYTAVEVEDDPTP